jgi:hypothetical protein
MVKPKCVLDYGLIRDQVERLLKLSDSGISPRRTKRNAVVVGTVPVLNNTFKTIHFLCSEKSEAASSTADAAYSPDSCLNDIGRPLYVQLPL